MNQRWRERPRCPALAVTPGRRGGVVHAIVGRADCPCPRAQVVQEERAARAHILASRFAGRMRPTNRTQISSCASPVFPQKRCARRRRSRQRTIAFFMLTPCSASSMLSAALRPGPRPGLRALTMPPLGMSQATTRWLATCRSLEGGLTRESHRRMLASSRQCRTALPPFANTANGARIRPAPTGPGIGRTPHIAD